MFQRVLLWISALFAISCLAIGVVHAAPYNERLPYALIDAGDRCAGESPARCWQGIRLGETTRAEALAILEAHPWVLRTFETSITVSWRWNGTQPEAIDERHDGVLRIERDRVTLIRVHTRLQFGDIWLAFGAPDDAILVRPASRSATYQVVEYDQEALHIVSTIGCPVSPQQFWRQTVTMGIGDVWFTEAIHGARFDVFNNSSWWRRVRRCRP
ncbi:hypothetical protein FBR02_06210 [Anaerolineae bacterium CFX9]|nr:hypothetical protein [Anaerolineae bacterium CFX9]